MNPHKTEKLFSVKCEVTLPNGFQKYAKDSVLFYIANPIFTVNIGKVRLTLLCPGGGVKSARRIFGGGLRYEALEQTAPNSLTFHVFVLSVWKKSFGVMR